MSLSSQSHPSKDSLDTALFCQPELIDLLTELAQNPSLDLAGRLDEYKALKDGLDDQVKQLAVKHYPLFIAKAEASQSVTDSLDSLLSLSQGLMTTLQPRLQQSIDASARQAQSQLVPYSKLNSNAWLNHTKLLELLEFPQLIETCIQAGYLDEAIALSNRVKQLFDQHRPSTEEGGGGSNVLSIVSRQVNFISRRLVQLLCQQLRSPLSLPACIKTVAYLRRTDALSESELRLKFLQARTSYLHSQLATATTSSSHRSSRHEGNLDSSKLKTSNGQPLEVSTTNHYNVYWALTRYIELTRVNLFDIVTQYRAVFTETTTNLPQPTSSRLITGECVNQHGMLLSSWLNRRIGEFLTKVDVDLEAMLQVQPTGDDSSDLSTLLTRLRSIALQCINFARSFGRIGFDFRPLLAPIFSRHLIALTQTHLDHILTEFTASLNQLPYQQRRSHCKSDSKDDDDPGRNQSSDHPPLDLLAAKLNEFYSALRLCCQVNLKRRFLLATAKLLTKCADSIVTVHHRLHLSTDDVAGLASAFASHLVPQLLTHTNTVLSGGGQTASSPDTNILLAKLGHTICRKLGTINWPLHPTSGRQHVFFPPYPTSSCDPSLI